MNWRKPIPALATDRTLFAKYLHAVSSSQVFVNDLPSGQVTHAAGDLNRHMDKILLGNCLQDQKKAILTLLTMLFSTFCSAGNQVVFTETTVKVLIAIYCGKSVSNAVVASAFTASQS